MTLFEQVSEKDKQVAIEKYNRHYGTNFQTLEKIGEYVVAHFPGCMGNLANFRPVKAKQMDKEAENT